MRWTMILGAGVAGAFLLASPTLMAREASKPAKRPNILLIVADDMGFSDIGAFGSEIPTPNLDRLASRGVRMTNFHVAPVCSPTRAMLLTGSDNHQVGLGTMAETLKPVQRGKPGYEGYLNDRALTLAQRLKSEGYFTAMAGKWHLGLTRDRAPDRMGFDRSFAMLRGESNHFRRSELTPGPDGPDEYRLDGEPADIPADFYSSHYFADTMSSFLKSRPKDQPFFAYLSFTAPHSPLQAPGEAIARYRGKYDRGYEVLAADRIAKLKALGIIPRSARPQPLAGAPAWNSLSPAERAISSRRMEIYAAMIDEMDRSIGRVLADLKKNGDADNTVVIFLSDNGAAGGAREDNPKWGPWIASNMNNALANMGAADSYVSTGSAWAQASGAPFAYFKGYTSEGGTLSPLIASGPGIARGRFEGRFGHVVDLAPTIVSLTGGSASNASGKAPLAGHDLTRLFATPRRQFSGPASPVSMELRGGRAVWFGPWKATFVSNEYAGIALDSLPWGSWRLYRLDKDRGETKDVSARHPDVLDRLANAYDRYAAENGVVLLPDSVRAPPPR